MSCVGFTPIIPIFIIVCYDEEVKTKTDTKVRLDRLCRMSPYLKKSAQVPVEQRPNRTRAAPRIHEAGA